MTSFSLPAAPAADGSRPDRRLAGLALVLAVYLGLCLLAYPYYYQIIDPDDTAYLKIAERWAAGDLDHAVNGMWSPLNSMLAALFSFTGTANIFLFKYLNMAFGCVVIAASGALLRKSSLPPRWRVPALLGLMPFLIFATYSELAADWLQCAILLLYLNLSFSARFTASVKTAIVCGALGALAYYAKYYSFHFFWLHFATVCFFRFFDFEKKKLDRRFWSWLGAGVGTLVVLSLPWVFLLHRKYGFWKLNYTGVIDLTWSLKHETVFENGPILPPAQPGAASWWEDPWWTQSTYLGPFSSGKIFVRQVAISVLAAGSFVKVLYEFSALALAVWGIAVLRFLRGGWKKYSFNTAAVLTFLTLPAGFFLFHFEGRFIWPLCLLAYILGLLLLREKLWANFAQHRIRLAVAALFVLSFAIWPAQELWRFIQRDDEAYTLGGQLREMRLQGTFITNGNQNVLARVAYLSGTGLCTFDPEGVEEEALLNAVIDHRVNYYIHLANSRMVLPAAVVSQLAEVSGGKIPGMKIYRLQ